MTIIVILNILGCHLSSFFSYTVMSIEKNRGKMKLRVSFAHVGRQTGKEDGKAEHAKRAIQESVFS